MNVVNTVFEAPASGANVGTGVEAPAAVINSDVSNIWSDDDDGIISCEEDDDIEVHGDNDSVAIHTTSAVGVDANHASPPDVHSRGFTVEQYCETKLLKILNDKQVPHGTYKEILEWSSEAKRMKYSFEPTRQFRK